MPSSSLKADPKDIILRAEGNYLVGRFRVLTEQCIPHSSQRMLRPEWVEHLVKVFEDLGIDRAQHPIKVLLECDDQSLRRMREICKANPHVVPWLPKDVRVLVYAGQHRVEACNQNANVKERWWFAEAHDHGMSYLFGTRSVAEVI